MERREFIVRLGKVAAGTILAWLGLSGKGESAPLVFDLGSPGDYPPGTVKYLNFRDAFLVSDEEGIYVFSSICPHNGCSIAWRKKEEYFECPCHRSLFDLEGKVLRGPARDPLPWLKLELVKKGNRLKLHREYRGVRGRKISHPA